MGIFLGQLPPAEIARFKAELAETLIANFCYPRFYDQRTQSLRMRPVDRAKRQEVWLYLSSFDFNAWSRVDLTSPDFQLYIERLFIQFVQRNRSFFGEQGRRRMTDVRMLIGTSASSVAQGLRSHLMGQKQGGAPFGSPRPVISWSVTPVDGRSDMSWEQISSATMLLQQQLQELRGEIRPSSPPPSTADSRSATGSTPRRPPIRPQSTPETVKGNEQAATTLTRPAPNPAPVPVAPAPVAPAAQVRTSQAPAAKKISVPLPSPMPAAATLDAPTQPTMPVSLQEATAQVIDPPAPVTPPASTTARIVKPEGQRSGSLSVVSDLPAPATQTPPAQRAMTPSTSTTVPMAGTNGQQLIVGDDDIAIFEQMRHQLIVWLRIEAITAGVEITGMGPAQLLEALRQQGRFDETRLQVVSTLLNLANQVIKTGMVSVLDYKQGLMFYLMHTRR